MPYAIILEARSDVQYNIIVTQNGIQHSATTSCIHARNLGILLQMIYVITQQSIYGVIVYFLPCHESLNYSTGQ